MISRTILTVLIPTSNIPCLQARWKKRVSYRKATHTDQYSDFHSLHPLKHKLSVVRTLIKRADTTVTEPGDFAEEHNHIKQALRTCGYKDWTLTRASIKS